MSRLHLPLSVSVLSVLLAAPSLASAASVCVAKPNTPLIPVAVVGVATPVGFVGPHQCFGVLDRVGTSTRVLVNAGSFKGEVDLPNNSLLQILAEDIEMRLRDGEEPWGLALAGTPVMIEAASEGGHIVRTVDGRVEARFLVEEGAMLPAERWPTLEPDEVHPGGKWPTAEHALPPAPAALSGKSGTRANVAAPLFAVDAVVRDSAIGALRYSITDPDAESPDTVRIVGPLFWVQGRVKDLDWRRETVKADPDAEEPQDLDEDGERDDWGGWADLDGYAIGGPSSPLPREVASKEAPLAHEPKGDRFASLMPGARVQVTQTDGSWLKVEYVWDGGKVSGWVDKKRLVKEGKEQTSPAVVMPKAAVVAVGEATVIWTNKGPEFATDKDGAPKLDKEGNQVIDPNETHVEAPNYPVAWMQRTVRERIDRIRYFYGRKLAQGQVAGTVTLSIKLDEAGLVTTEIGGTLTDEELAALVEESFDGVAWPERDIPKKSRKDTKDYGLSIEMTVRFSPLKG